MLGAIKGLPSLFLTLEGQKVKGENVLSVKRDGALQPCLSYPHVLAST